MAREPSSEATPLEYLKQADREMAAGNRQLAAGLMWKAAQAALISLAKERKIALRNDLSELARDLETDGSTSECRYPARVVTAKILRDHAAEDFLEDYELEGAYEVTRKFVLGCCDELG